VHRSARLALPSTALPSLVLTFLLVAATGGCASAEHPGSSSASLSTNSDADQAPLSMGSGPDDADESAPPPPGPASQDAASTAAAVAVALQTMTAFARPTVDAGTWFVELEPLLTPAARTAFYGTDPDEVPAHAVTGPGRPETTPSAYLATVTVPTDVGDYRLLLSREDGAAGWLVETITPPDGVR